MAFSTFFKFGKKRNSQGVQVAKIKKEKAPAIGEMAAGNLTAAADAVAQMMEQREMATKILAVQDGISSTVLVDYALKMAHKLDCEIVALDVTDGPLEHEGERRQRETARFYERARQSAEAMQLKADAMGVKVQHLMHVGNQEEIIKQLSTEDKAIRYVLTKPVQESLEADQRRARVPVFDLSCSRL